MSHYNKEATDITEGLLDLIWTYLNFWLETITIKYG